MSMTPSKVVSTVKSCGIECAHLAFPEGSAPALPWAVYYLDYTDNLHADNSTWDSKPYWIVELYEKTKDVDLELSIAQAIEEAFMSPPSMEETWIESENCRMTTYRFTEI